MSKKRNTTPCTADSATSDAPVALDAPVESEAMAAAQVPDEPAERPGAFDLGSSCTLADAGALRLACIAAMDAKDPPVIDGTRVERVDAAGIQLLVGFAIDCMERSINFSWAGRSPELSRGIRLLGVEALLESPGVAASPMGGAV